jgi:hypothetical protein
MDGIVTIQMSRLLKRSRKINLAIDDSARKWSLTKAMIRVRCSKATSAPSSAHCKIQQAKCCSQGTKDGDTAGVCR